MIINYCGFKLKLEFTNTGISEGFQGTFDFQDDLITLYVDACHDPVSTFIHEVCHFHLYQLIGDNGNNEIFYKEEQVCCIVGKVSSFLIHGNGHGIFKAVEKEFYKQQKRLLK